MSINFLRRGAEEQAVESAPMAAPVAELAVSRSRSSEQGAANYDRVVRWAVALGVLLVPLFVLPWTTGVLELNKQLLLVAAAGVGLVAWLLGVVVSGQVRIRWTTLDIGVLALFVATIVATIFSVSVRSSVFGSPTSLSESLVSVTALTVLYFLATWTFRGEGKVLRTVLVSSACLALIYGLLQVFGVFVFHGFAAARAFNTVGSVNGLGVLAAFLLPLFMKVSVRIPRVPVLDIAKVAAVLAFVLLVVLNWWVLWAIAIAGMVALIAFDSIALALQRTSGERAFRIAKFVAPMTVTVLAVFLMIVHFSVPTVKANIPVEVAPSFSFSSHVIGSVLGQRLVTGYGPENFSIAFDQFGAGRLANSSLSNVKFPDATSSAMTAVATAGLLGILAVLALVLVVGFAIKRVRTYVAAHAKNAGVVSGVASAVCAATVAFFLYPFSLSLMVAFYALVAMLALTLWHDAERVTNIEERPAYSLASSLGFIVGLIAVLTGGYFVATRYTADVVFAEGLTVTDPAVATDLYVRAVNWNGGDDRVYRALSQATLASVSKELQHQDAKDAQQQTRIQNLVSSSITIAKRATDVAPREADNWYNLGTVYQSLFGLVDGVDALAEQAYLKAADLRPGDPAYQNKIGSMYLAKADLLRQLSKQAGQNGQSLSDQADAALVQAEDAFKKAIDLSNTYGVAIYNLGAVYDRQGKVNDAIKQLERIIPYNADQPNLVFELGLLYYRAGRKDDAYKALQRAVLLSPDFANARWYLALILEERKDIPGAIAQLQEILKTNPDNQTVTDKLASLQQGQQAIPPEKVLDQKPLQ